MIEYKFETFGGLVLDCTLDYDPGEMDGDFRIEPQAELVQALVEDIDIKEVLSDFWIALIERECVNNQVAG
jgi:hypothetical protein